MWLCKHKMWKYGQYLSHIFPSIISENVYCEEINCLSQFNSETNNLQLLTALTFWRHSLGRKLNSEILYKPLFCRKVLYFCVKFIDFYHYLFSWLFEPFHEAESQKESFFFFSGGGGERVGVSFVSCLCFAHAHYHDSTAVP